MGARAAVIGLGVSVSGFLIEEPCVAGPQSNRVVLRCGLRIVVT